MCMALRAKNKLGFVDGSIPAPNLISVNFAQWVRVYDMVTSWLLHSIATEIASSVIYAETAHEIWTDLENHFLQPNTTKIYRIKQEIADWKQDKLNVFAYFSKLKALWDKLSSYVALSACHCGSSTKLLAFLQQNQGMKFLQDLHESFPSLRSHLLLQDPLPPIEKLY
ncbi:uncharacterized protein LOC122644781 [Telopea speciosissima]|uniref:uncharacterized protein LOC122644781 n=1 Tax=Telopea speciosissima TaxID=54955 RepID=UPI001CC405A7|nr:uncharacterized protein LOC122644781 [Telopea speciosissima]